MCRWPCSTDQRSAQRCSGSMASPSWSPERGQPVRPVVVLADQTGGAELTQPLVEHARRHVVAAGPERPGPQAAVAQLPQDAERPAAAEQVERGHEWPARGRAADRAARERWVSRASWARESSRGRESSWGPRSSSSARACARGAGAAVLNPKRYGTRDGVSDSETVEVIGDGRCRRSTHRARGAAVRAGHRRATAVDDAAGSPADRAVPHVRPEPADGGGDAALGATRAEPITVASGCASARS